MTSTDKRITCKDPGFIPMVFQVPNQRDELLLALSITGLHAGSEREASDISATMEGSPR